MSHESRPESTSDQDNYQREVVGLLRKRYVPRDDVIALQYKKKSGKVAYAPWKEDYGKGPLILPTDEHFLTHIKGRLSLGSYMVTPDDRAKGMIFDLDLVEAQRETFLNGHPEEIKRLRDDLLAAAELIASQTKEILWVELGQDVPLSIVFSGNKGYHVDPYTDFLPAAQLRELGTHILRSVGFIAANGKPGIATDWVHRDFPDLEVELFPKQSALKDSDDGLGNLVRLPLGINLKSGNPSYFVDRHGDRVDDLQALRQGTFSMDEARAFMQVEGPTYLVSIEPEPPCEPELQAELSKEPVVGLEDYTDDDGLPDSYKQFDVDLEAKLLTDPPALAAKWTGKPIGDKAGRELMFSCPWPGFHSHGDNDPTASIDPSTGLWNCHAGHGGGDMYDLYAITHGWGDQAPRGSRFFDLKVELGKDVGLPHPKDAVKPKDKTTQGTTDDPTGGAEEGAEEPRSSIFIDWSTVWDEDDEDEWLLEPVIPKGRAVALFASPKVGKSLLLLDLVAAAATGGHILGQQTIEPITVLYLDYEMTTRDVTERLLDMGYGPETDFNRLHYALVTGPPLDTPEGGAWVMKLVDEVQPDLVVIDTVTSALVGKESDADTIRAFWRHTGVLLKRRGITVARLDHAGKDTEKGQRGTSAKAGDVDVVWQLKSTEDGVKLVCTHSRMPWVPREVPLRRVTDPHLQHLRASASWPAGTKEVADKLDALGVHVDAGRRVAAKALKDADPDGKGRSNVLVNAAVNFRRKRAETTDDGSE